MKIAFHNTGGFTPRWIEYCEQNSIDYKLVNAYDSNIVEQVKDCDAFMWHHHQANYKDVLFAKQLLFSLEQSGKVVFPNFNTGWHFDDKVGEKYLFEAIDAPMVPTFVFYTKEDANEWIDKASFPKVFKLRGGAGSANVMLARTAADAKKLVRKAFGNGFPQYSSWSNLKERLRKYHLGQTDLKDVLKGVARFFVKPEFARMHSNEKGYVYFQDFIPNNTFDLRIIVVGDKAFGVKRMCRKDDFRASGSGSLLYDRTQIDERCVRISFDISEKLHFQSMGYDFVFDKHNNPLIVEMCYGYAVAAYDFCEGYWDRDMNWYPGQKFNFCGWMVEEVMKEVNSITE